MPVFEPVPPLVQLLDLHDRGSECSPELSRERRLPGARASVDGHDAELADAGRGAPRCLDELVERRRLERRRHPPLAPPDGSYTCTRSGAIRMVMRGRPSPSTATWGLPV